VLAVVLELEVVEVDEVVVGQLSVPLKIVKLSQLASTPGLVLPLSNDSSILIGEPIPALHV